MKRLEFLIDGVWLAPVDPPPTFTEDPELALRRGAWTMTVGEFQHPRHGRVSCVLRNCLVRVATSCDCPAGAYCEDCRPELFERGSDGKTWPVVPGFASTTSVLRPSWPHSMIP